MSGLAKYFQIKIYRSESLLFILNNNVSPVRSFVSLGHVENNVQLFMPIDYCVRPAEKPKFRKAVENINAILRVYIFS